MLKTIEITGKPSSKTSDEKQKDKEIFFDSIYSENAITMSQIRYDLNHGNIDLNSAQELFHIWKNTDTYAIFYVLDYTRPCGIARDGGRQYECNFFAKKLMKRGNDVYFFRVQKRIQPLKNICLYHDKTQLLDTTPHEVKISKCLCFDLTYTTSLCSPSESAKCIGPELNLFLSNLTKQYGKIKKIRVFEFTKQGYAHVHLIVYFHDANFHVTPMISRKNNKLYFRVDNHQRTKMRKFWHSNINIFALTNTRQLLYRLKYLTKEFYDQQGSLTPFYLSLYGNRGYAISNGLPELLNDLFNSATVGASLRLDNIKYNSNQKKHNFCFLKVYCTKKHYDKWNFEVEPPPDCLYTENGTSLIDIRRA